MASRSWIDEGRVGAHRLLDIPAYVAMVGGSITKELPKPFREVRVSSEKDNVGRN